MNAFTVRLLAQLIAGSVMLPGAIPNDVSAAVFTAVEAASMIVAVTPAAAGAVPLSYQVSYRVTGSGAYSTPVDTAGATSLQLTGLAPATSYDVRVTASNLAGASAGVSFTQATSSTYAVTMPFGHLIGKPSSYALASGYGTVISQQWYRNTGSGPVAITGATGATYTPTATPTNDAGSWLSVRVVTSLGNFASFEFPSMNAVISMSAQKTVANASSRAQYLGRQNISQTFNAPVVIRAIPDASPTTVIDTFLAPGTYVNTATGDLSNFNTPNNVTIYIIASPGTSPVLAQQADTAPATASRPAGNSGNGLFVANASLYESNGNKFRARGMNRLHWDGSVPGVFNAGANIHRVWLDLSQVWATKNKPLLDTILANHVVPMITNATTRAFFSASFADNGDGTATMNVSSWTHGNIWVGMAIPAGSGVAACTVTAMNGSGYTGNGKTGTYQVSVGQTVAGPVAYTISSGTTGSSVPGQLLSNVQTLIDTFSNIQPYLPYCVINIANEWGPQASSSNTVWRDTMITAVQMMRNAGFTCPLVLDAGFSGQDSYGFINHAAAVLASGDQNNGSFTHGQSSLIFSIHIYGLASQGWVAGRANGVLAQMAAVAAANQGMAYVVGEFGYSYTPNSATTSLSAREMIADAESLNFGWIPWAWDDPNYPMLVTGRTYATSDPTDLDMYGTTVILDSVFGLHALAQPATSF